MLQKKELNIQWETTIFVNSSQPSLLDSGGIAIKN